MQASIAHANQATNAIYAEKRAAGDSSWNVPDKYQNPEVPRLVWPKWPRWPDLVSWERSDRDLTYKCHWPAILIKPDFIMSMSMGGGKWTANRSLPSHDQRQQKTWLPPAQRLRSHPSPHKFEVDLKLFEDVDEIVFPSGLKKWARWSGLVSSKEDRTWTFPTALSRVKARRKQAFHLHVYQKSQGQLKGYSHYASSGKAKPSSLHSCGSIQETPTPLVGAPGEPKVAPGPTTGKGNGSMWAASALLVRTGDTPEVGAIACWDDGGDMAMSPQQFTDVEHDQKFRSKERTTTAILYIDNFAVWFDPTNPSGELSPTSTQIKAFITSRKRHSSLNECLFLINV